MIIRDIYTGEITEGKPGPDSLNGKLYQRQQRQQLLTKINQAKKLLRTEWENNRLLPEIFSALMRICDSIESTATTPQTEWSDNVYTDRH